MCSFLHNNVFCKGRCGNINESRPVEEAATALEVLKLMDLLKKMMQVKIEIFDENQFVLLAEELKAKLTEAGAEVEIA